MSVVFTTAPRNVTQLSTGEHTFKSCLEDLFTHKQYVIQYYLLFTLWSSYKLYTKLTKHILLQNNNRNVAVVLEQRMIPYPK